MPERTQMVLRLATYGTSALSMAVVLMAAVLMAGILMALALAWPGPAWSQSDQAPQPPAQAVPEQPPVPDNSGLVDAIGKFFQDPALRLPSLKTPQQAIEDLNARAKDVTDNLSRMSGRQVVAGRVKCPVAANGAPDCKSAANKLCTDKGFKEGQSVDSDSAESCSASVLLSGKKAEPGDCRIENFVIRALCQ